VPYSEQPRTTIYRTRRIPVVRVLVTAAIAAVLCVQLLTSSSSTASWSSKVVGAPIDVLRGEPRGGLGEGGGSVPDGTTVFDDEVPGVANLDSDLLGPLRRAAGDAANRGVAFQVDSGWRSPEYQEQLRREAVSKYGSEAEAARWVASPNTSAHVSGDAVDIGPAAAAMWLSQNGAAYGLCRIYGNEPWHFELRPEASTNGCPPMYADPTHDPRMHQ
jgi:hypothetical protein